MAYRRTLLTFIDVLGFSEVVRKDDSGDQVGKVLGKFHLYGKEDTWGERKARGATTHVFSDLSVRCTPLVNGEGWKSDGAALEKELEDLTYIQGELSADNIHLRGGVTVGMAFFDESSVYGPALLDAYELESQRAQYPRIVLHADVIKEFATPGSGGYGIYAEEDGLRLTRPSSDGFHCVDYLGNFPREVQDEDEEGRKDKALSYIRPRKEHIEEKLRELPVLSRVRTKYVWLGEYHDQVVNEVLGMEGKTFLIGG